MFNCDAGGGPVATGHRMRPGEFAAVDGPRSFRCPACAQVHSWTTDTAWLQERRPIPAYVPMDAASAA